VCKILYFILLTFACTCARQEGLRLPDQAGTFLTPMSFLRDEAALVIMNPHAWCEHRQQATTPLPSDQGRRRAPA
jgi:hypothetical protein